MEKVIGLKVKLLGNKENLSELGQLSAAIKQVGIQLQGLKKQTSGGGSGGTGGGGTSGGGKPRGTGDNVAALKREAEALAAQGKAYDDLVRRAAELKRTQSEVTAAIREQQREFERSRFAAGSYRDLNSQLGKLRDTYRNLSELERKDPIGQTTLIEIQKLDKALKGIDADMGQYFRNVGNYRSAFTGLSSAVERGAALLGLSISVEEIVSQNAKISDAIANVSKTSGLAQEEVGKLSELLKFRDTRTSLADQLGIAEIGGRLGLGKTTEDLASFVAAIDTANVALGDQFNNSAEQVTDTLAGIRNVLTGFQTDNVSQDILNIGNALNVLEASGVGTAPVIADFVNRIGGVAGPLGVTAEQIFGLSTTLDELQVTAERGSSATVRLLTELAAGPEKFAELVTDAGLIGGTQEFISLVETDLVGAFALVAEASQKTTDTNVEFSRLLDELGINGVGATEVFAKLGTNTDLLRSRIELAGTALQSTSSLTDEFNKKNNNLAASIEKLKNELLALVVSTDTQGFLKAGVDGISQFIAVLKELPNFIRENKAELIALGVALISFNALSIAAAVNTLRLAVAEKAYTVATTAARIATTLFNVALRTNPIGLVVSAVALLVGGLIALSKRSEAVRTGIEDFKNKIIELYDSNILVRAALFTTIELIRFLGKVFTEPKQAISGFLDSLKFFKTLFVETLNISIIKAQIFGKKIKAAFSIGGASEETKAEIKTLEAAFQASQDRITQGAVDSQKARLDGERKTSQETIAIAKQTAEQVTAAYRAQLAAQATFLSGIGQQAQDVPFILRGRSGAATGASSGAQTQVQQTDQQKEAGRKSADAARKAAEDRLKAAQQIADLEAALIRNEFDRRIKQAEIQSEREIAALVGSPDQVRAQTALLKEQLTRSMAEINAERATAGAAALAYVQKFNDDLLALEISSADRLLSAELAALDRSAAARLKFIEVGQNTAQARLSTQLQSGAITAEQYEAQLTAIQQQGIQDRFLAEQTDGVQRLALQAAIAEQSTTQAQQAFTDQLLAIETARQAEQLRLSEELQSGNLDDNAYAQGVLALDRLLEAQRLDNEQAFEARKLEIQQQYALDALAFQTDIAEKEQRLQDEKNKRILESEKQRRDVIAGFEEELGSLIGEFLTGQEKDIKGFLKATLNASLDALERTITISIAEATARSLASAGSVATFGAAGLARAALLTGLIKGAFAGVKGIVNSFEGGGTIGGANFGSAVPSGGGIANGPSHVAGGIPGTSLAGGVEIQGGEFVLHNGRNTHIINRESTTRNIAQLRALQSISGRNYRPGVAAQAARINSMADGGTISPIAVTPLAAPVFAPTVAQGAAADASVNTAQEIRLLSAMIMEAIAAVNGRIDRIEVINRPDQTIIEGNRAIEVRNRRTL